MTNVLMCSSIKPGQNGGVANVEYYTMKGLREKGVDVQEYFPYKYSYVVSDVYYGARLKSDRVIHCHTNMSWNNKHAIRTFHGCTALGEEVARVEKDYVLKQGLGGKAYLKVNKVMEKKCANTNHCITVSQYVADALVHYYKTPVENIRVVHNGVDSSRFFPQVEGGLSFRQKLGLSESDFVVTWTGHFEFNKGIHYLCQVIKELGEDSSVQFIVRSSVKDRDIPVAYQKFLRQKNVKLIPHGPDMNEFYNAGDVHLLTSTYEPFCLTILEAMCSGKPVIASKSGGHVEVINEKSGDVLDYQDVSGMVEKIKYLQQDELEKKNRGKFARETILNGFTYQHMADKTLLAYDYFGELK